MKWILDKCRLTWQDWLIVAIGSVPAFYQLGRPAIYIWDEAVYANASFDMAFGGSSWWVPVQEAYNTKPPLVLWLQALALKLFSEPEWAIRLPSALAVTGILLLLVVFLRRRGIDQAARWLVMISFVAHEGFIRHHIARTGDLDAVMCFFVTGYLLIALDAIYQRRWNVRYQVAFSLFVLFAFYAKSIAGWMMLGPLGLVWLLSPIRNVLWSKKFLLSAFAVVVLCLLYYFSREIRQPGFLQLVWWSEYMRFSHTIMPWHEHPFGYYFANFVRLRTFTPWIFVVGAVTVYFLFFKKQDALRQQVLPWIILAAAYLLLISVPSVKLEWYDAPVYPFFALLLGTGARDLLKIIPRAWLWLLALPIALLMFRKLDFIRQDVHVRDPLEQAGSILRQTDLFCNLKVFMAVRHPQHQLQLDFYRKVMSRARAFDVPVVGNTHEVYSMDHLIIAQADSLGVIQSRYTLDTLKIWPGLGYEVRLKTPVGLTWESLEKILPK